jgi:hypothetical protein
MIPSQQEQDSLIRDINMLVEQVKQANDHFAATGTAPVAINTSAFNPAGIRTTTGNMPLVLGIGAVAIAGYFLFIK